MPAPDPWWLKPFQQLRAQGGNPPGQDALPSQGHSHPHTDWGSVDTPIDPTCPPLRCGRKPNAQRKPTCKLQTVALARNWFPRINVRMKRQWSKRRLSRNCCRSHRFFGRHQKYTELAISQPWGIGSQKPAGERVAKYLFWTQASSTHHGHASIAWPAGGSAVSRQGWGWAACHRTPVSHQVALAMVLGAPHALWAQRPFLDPVFQSSLSWNFFPWVCCVWNLGWHRRNNS